MPNQMKFEVHFSSADLQELIDLDTEKIQITGEYSSNEDTGVWGMTVTAVALTDEVANNVIVKVGCPTPCPPKIV